MNLIAEYDTKGSKRTAETTRKVSCSVFEPSCLIFHRQLPHPFRSAEGVVWWGGCECAMDDCQNAPMIVFTLDNLSALSINAVSHDQAFVLVYVLFRRNDNLFNVTVDYASDSFDTMVARRRRPFNNRNNTNRKPNIPQVSYGSWC